MTPAGRIIDGTERRETMSTEENKALARRAIEEIWNKKNLDAIDEIYSANYASHVSGSPLGEIRGPEGVRQFVGAYLHAFPDVRFTIEDLVAEGDTVVDRWTAHGTHQGELMGIPPTGRQATVTGTEMNRCAGGRIVETWTEWDALGLLQQLGVIPSPEQTPA
jgi:steroid delta-isomerase-like uncharacterized protein